MASTSNLTLSEQCKAFIYSLLPVQVHQVAAYCGLKNVAFFERAMGHGASQQAKVRKQLSVDLGLIEPFVGKSEVTAENGGLVR